MGKWSRLKTLPVARVIPVAAVFLRLLMRTWRIGVEDRSGILERDGQGPLIYVFWHNRILPVTAAFLRVYPRWRKGVSVLTSASRDGDVLAAAAGSLGMGAVRGSSSRRGAVALRECLSLLAEGGDVAVTPDGPRGPRYVFGPGVIHLAGRSGAAIQPIHVRVGAAWRLRTWDGFVIPKPFARVEVELAPLERVGACVVESESGFEAERRRIEELLQPAEE